MVDFLYTGTYHVELRTDAPPLLDGKHHLPKPQGSSSFPQVDPNNYKQHLTLLRPTQTPNPWFPERAHG